MQKAFQLIDDADHEGSFLQRWELRRLVKKFAKSSFGTKFMEYEEETPIQVYYSREGRRSVFIASQYVDASRRKRPVFAIAHYFRSQTDLEFFERLRSDLVEWLSTKVAQNADPNQRSSVMQLQELKFGDPQIHKGQLQYAYNHRGFQTLSAAAIICLACFAFWQYLAVKDVSIAFGQIKPVPAIEPIVRSWTDGEISSGLEDRVVSPEDDSSNAEKSRLAILASGQGELKDDFKLLLTRIDALVSALEEASKGNAKDQTVVTLGEKIDAHNSLLKTLVENQNALLEHFKKSDSPGGPARPAGNSSKTAPGDSSGNPPGTSRDTQSNTGSQLSKDPIPGTGPQSSKSQQGNGASPQNEALQSDGRIQGGGLRGEQ